MDGHTKIPGSIQLCSTTEMIFAMVTMEWCRFGALSGQLSQLVIDLPGNTAVNWVLTINTW